MLTNVLPITLALAFLFSFSVSSHSETNTKASYAYPQVVILQYHHVSTETPPSTSLSPDMFVTHLELIEELDFQVLPLIEVVERIQNKQGFKQKTVAITFDDAYDSIYLTAYPLLKQRNWPFTVFINPQAVDENHGNSMTWNQIREMQNNGATIANHSYEHLHLLKKLEDESLEQWQNRIRQDTEKAQDRLEQELGIKHRYFAYPFGEFDEHLKRLLADLGYIAFSQQSGPVNHTSDFLSLPRFPAAGIYANPKTLKTKLNSLAFEIIDVQPEQHIRSVNDAAPRLTLTVKAENVRHHQAQCFYQGEAIDTQTEKQGDQIVITTAFDGQLNLGRSRYNCTAPAKNSRNYYWYSMPFVALDDEQHWID